METVVCAFHAHFRFHGDWASAERVLRERSVFVTSTATPTPRCRNLLRHRSSPSVVCIHVSSGGPKQVHADLRTQEPETCANTGWLSCAPARLAPSTCSSHARADEPAPAFHDLAISMTKTQGHSVPSSTHPQPTGKHLYGPGVSAASLDGTERNARHPKGRRPGGGCLRPLDSPLAASSPRRQLGADDHRLSHTSPDEGRCWSGLRCVSSARQNRSWSRTRRPPPGRGRRCPPARRCRRRRRRHASARG